MGQIAQPKSANKFLEKPVRSAYKFSSFPGFIWHYYCSLFLWIRVEFFNKVLFLINCSCQKLYLWIRIILNLQEIRAYIKYTTMDKLIDTVKRFKTALLIVVLLILTVVAFWGYCFEAGGESPEPLRVVLQTKGGPVVFDHRYHSSPEGVDLACSDCHHDYDPEKKDSSEKVEMNCRRCHYSNQEEFQEMCSDATIHKRCIGYNCINCHSDGLENCGMCHE